jgi:hypothetical protein
VTLIAGHVILLAVALIAKLPSNIFETQMGAKAGMAAAICLSLLVWRILLEFLETLFEFNSLLTSTNDALAGRPAAGGGADG